MQSTIQRHWGGAAGGPTCKGGGKRSLLTDGGGVPLGVAVKGANRNDFKVARATLESVPIPRP